MCSTWIRGLTSRKTNCSPLTHQPGPQPGAVELYPGEDALRAQLAGTVVEVAPAG
ncbi:hypothetical protein MAHJHV33_49940 [Mycobacterium avium subsp. hominissuis]